MINYQRDQTNLTQTTFDGVAQKKRRVRTTKVVDLHVQTREVDQNNLDDVKQNK